MRARPLSILRPALDRAVPTAALAASVLMPLAALVRPSVEPHRASGAAERRRPAR
ncbi:MULTISPECIES: hypothetical protein [unclassified Methylobacterium]|jgi:hypothetical protein|uniref:hypothetical protein n=1 Tax=unclassified Methylobacterium TaxID=2615210 RepID=UPI001367FF9C|nr:hypothetical protein [Methylobacterium sp. 2A]